MTCMDKYRIVLGILVLTLVSVIPVNGEGMLQSVESRQCLHIMNLNTANGGTFDFAACTLADGSQGLNVQDWKNYASAPGIIKFDLSQRCLNVNGNGVNQWQCGSGSGQQWQILNGVWAGAFQLKNIQSGNCLTAESVNVMDLTPCSTNPTPASQLWKIIQLPNFKQGLVKSVANSGSCLAVPGPSLLDGASVDLETCTYIQSPLNQVWNVKEWGPAWIAGTHTLAKNYYCDKCLSLLLPLPLNGIRVQQFSCGGLGILLNQCWNILGNIYDVFELQNAVTDKCLATHGSYSDQQTCNGASNQKFRRWLQAWSLLTRGSPCTNNNQCLSNICTLDASAPVCFYSLPGYPCQTGEDCTSMDCDGGLCA